RRANLARWGAIFCTQHNSLPINALGRWSGLKWRRKVLGMPLARSRVGRYPSTTRAGTMIRGLFDNSSLTAQLRGGLEEASATQRGIGRRVSEALMASTTTAFTDASQAAMAKAAQAEADIQREMASLADTQIRYE